MADVELDYMVPAADLQPFLGLFYRFASPAVAFEDVERAGSAQLRFRLSPGEGCYHFPDGSVQEAAPYHLIGTTTGPMTTCVEGPVWGFGVGLSPAGWAALLGSDASALVNRCVDATALFGDSVAEAAIGLRGCRTAAAMMAAIEPWLRRQLAGDHHATLGFVRAVDDWLAGSASPVLDVLVEMTGLSRRQIERRCNAVYGCPPKLLARKYRALRAAVALASHDEAPVEGFYDQSHMIREIKAFTGLTPGRLREEPGLLAQLTISRRRALAGKVGDLVSAT